MQYLGDFHSSRDLPIKDRSAEGALASAALDIEQTPEFSQKQLHKMIDMAVEQLCLECKVASGSFDEVAVSVKSAFPCGAEVDSESPFFSREQVRHLLKWVAEKCGECLAERRHAALREQM